jgi:hypothetical protein
VALGAGSVASGNKSRPVGGSVGPVDVAVKAIISNQDVLNRGSGVADGMTPSDPVTVQQLNSALASLPGGSTPPPESRAAASSGLSRPR